MTKITKCKEILEMGLSLEHIDRTQEVMQKLQSFVNELLVHKKDPDQDQLFTEETAVIMPSKKLDIDLAYDWAISVIVKNDPERGNRSMTVTVKRADSMANSNILLSMDMDYFSSRTEGDV